MAVHPRCGKAFPESHCGACCENFTGQTAFDAHRFGPMSSRRCMPAWVLPLRGLAEVNNSWGFLTPEQHAARLERMAMMRQARNA